MDLSLIYSKTSKGGKAVVTKSRALASSHLAVLSRIDGKTPACSILATLKLDEEKFAQALTQLLDEAYIQVMQDFGPSVFDLKTAIEVSEISTEDFLKLELPEEESSKTQEQLEAEARALAYAQEQASKEAQAREQEEAEHKLLMVTDILAKSGHKIDIEKLAEAAPPPTANFVPRTEPKHWTPATQPHAEAIAPVAQSSLDDSQAEGIATPASPSVTDNSLTPATVTDETVSRKIQGQSTTVEMREQAERQAQQLKAAMKAEARADERAAAEKERLKREQAEANAKRKADEKARKEDERRARKEQEAARKRAEQQEREEAKTRARIEAERRTREETERKAKERAEAEIRARETAEQKAKEKAALQAAREEEAKVKAEFLRKTREEARIRNETLAIERAAAKAEARRRAESKAIIRAQKWAHTRALVASTCSSGVKRLQAIVRPAIVIFTVIAVISLLLLQFVSLGMWVQPVERAIAATIDEPVNIRDMRASLWPMPHLVLEEVAFGHAADMTARTIDVYPTLLTLLDERKQINALNIEGFTVNQEAVGRLSHWLTASTKQQNYQIDTVSIRDIVIKGTHHKMPAFHADIQLTERNTFYSATLHGEGLQVKVSPQDSLFAIEIQAQNWAPPFNPALVFDELSAKGVVTPHQLDLQTIEGNLFGGTMKGALAIQRADTWKTAGRLQLAKINLAAAAPAVSENALLQGNLYATADIVSTADGWEQLLANADIHASFEAERGQIGGIDLARAAAGRDQVSGATRFDELNGNWSLEDGRYSLTQLALAAGPLKAQGEIVISPQQELSGKVQTRLDLGSRQMQNRFSLTGTLANVRAGK